MMAKTLATMMTRARIIDEIMKNQPTKRANSSRLTTPKNEFTFNIICELSTWIQLFTQWKNKS